MAGHNRTPQNIVISQSMSHSLTTMVTETLWSHLINQGNHGRCWDRTNITDDEQ